MIYRLPMMGVLPALSRVTFRRGSAVVGSSMGSTGRPRHFSSDGFNNNCPCKYAQDVRFGPNLGLVLTENESITAAAVEFKYKTDALYIKAIMPGVDKKNLKVYVEDTFVKAEGVGVLDPDFKGDNDEEDEAPKTYMVMVNLMELRFYKVHEIEAVFKNQVLKVKVPTAEPTQE